MSSGERGAATLPLLAVAVVVALLGAVVGSVGQLLTASSQASAAADAAALAAAPLTFRPFGGASSPAAEAAHFAAVNGARLVSCRCAVEPGFHRREVTVEVEVTVETILFGARSVRASSRASFRPAHLHPDVASDGPEAPVGAGSGAVPPSLPR